MQYKYQIDKMTISEKCGLLSGRDNQTTKPIERLDIDSIYLSDGPTGLRKQVGSSDHLGLNESQPSTCWPTASALACSWDPELCESIGQHLGMEAIAQEVNVVLGPGLNIKRSPLCGRNFEYFSEDPYLSGKLAAGYIRGIQSQKVAACPKHFAANSQELNRMTNNSVVDERTLREIYLTNFEIAVKEGNPKSIMSSYNKINGIYANENEHLLQTILVKEWGFDGVVISDWGGSNDHVQGVMAGSHLEMPGSGGISDRELESAVEEGLISEELVNQQVDKLLDFIFSVRSDSQDQTIIFDEETHQSMAEKAAEQSIVLLKNHQEILPLMPGTRIAIIGDFANVPRYQGAGSSHVNPTRLESTLDVIDKFDLENMGFAPGFRRNGKSDTNLQVQAIEIAKKTDVVLLFMGLPEIYETEGMDREHMRLPSNQKELLHKLAAINPNIVVILSGGSPVEMPWIEDCKALVLGGLGGQAGAPAMLKVLTGQVNPSGKLAETYPMVYEDMPVSTYYPGKQRSAEYREGPYVGYRYFETVDTPAHFPFGFGLSYTSFEYTNLIVSESRVSFTIKNTGKIPGSEVAQVYIGCPDSKVFRPTKELKGFAKVFLIPEESKSVDVFLDDKAFRYFNIYSGHWEIEPTCYRIMVGSSVQDIHLSANLDIKGTAVYCPYNPETIISYYSGNVKNVSKPEFEALLGFAAPESDWDLNSPLSMNDAICQMYYARSGLARLIFRLLRHFKNTSIARGKPDLNILFIYHLPFRGIVKMTGGLVTKDMAQAMLVMVNGNLLKGLTKLFRAFLFRHKDKKRI